MDTRYSMTVKFSLSLQEKGGYSEVNLFFPISFLFCIASIFYGKLLCFFRLSQKLQRGWRRPENSESAQRFPEFHSFCCSFCKRCKMFLYLPCARVSFPGFAFCGVAYFVDFFFGIGSVAYAKYFIGLERYSWLNVDWNSNLWKIVVNVPSSAQLPTSINSWTAAAGAALAWNQQPSFSVRGSKCEMIWFFHKVITAFLQ